MKKKPASSKDEKIVSVRIAKTAADSKASKPASEQIERSKEAEALGVAKITWSTQPSAKKPFLRKMLDKILGK